MWEAANGIAPCGNPSMWCGRNMAYHMVRVFSDHGALAGLTFADTFVSKVPEQASLSEETVGERSRLPPCPTATDRLNVKFVAP